MDRRAHARDLRKGRYSEPGRLYVVTAVTRHREPVFEDLLAARILVRTLRREQEMARAQTLAFVVMPDHIHWLLRLGEGAALSSVVRAVKAVSAHRLGRAVWQDGFHDRAIRREEDLAAVARYIVANPLRARLVERIGDYPHWDAVWL
jgi:REP element-mobilizing transposase RayT